LALRHVLEHADAGLEVDRVGRGEEAPRVDDLTVGQRDPAAVEGPAGASS
jgi:hypothetical protein